ncbi:unknown [Firmicutes bacterium CAG:882]|jgi:hypothetical protein|nr:unknown [Firmicutes bacterium CAG:882]
MKGRLEEAQELYNSSSVMLCSELSQYMRDGISVTVGGYQASVNRRLTDMLLREGPCTYMRSYSFDEMGKVTGVEFQCVRLSE